MATQTSSTVNAAQIRAGIEILKAVADAIRELGEVPAGTMYAHLMGRMDYERFDQIIRTLVGAGLIERHSSGLLVWKGAR